MSDRRVQQLTPHPEPDEASSSRRFSDYAASRNIVLLGDPGAGKTHLFTEAARDSGGRYLKTRDFLNIRSFPPDSMLFIDALDEQRTSRGDGLTIDKVVQKLFEIQPAKVVSRGTRGCPR